MTSSTRSLSITRIISQPTLRNHMIHSRKITSFSMNRYSTTRKPFSFQLLASRHHVVINSWRASKSIQQIAPSTTRTRYLSTDKRNINLTEVVKATKKPRKVTTLSIAAKKRRNQKITMVTAYDYPSAVHVDRAGMDIVLVGDSCAMVELGFETTQVCIVHIILSILEDDSHTHSTNTFSLLISKPITLDQMIHHCQAVKRGAPNRPLLIGDMPFGSYEFKNVDIALQNAYRMVKEGGMDAVKFEVRKSSCVVLNAFAYLD